MLKLHEGGQVYQVSNKYGLSMISFIPYHGDSDKGDLTVSHIPFPLIKEAAVKSGGDEGKFFCYLYSHMLKKTIPSSVSWLKKHERELIDETGYVFENLTMKQLENLALVA